MNFDELYNNNFDRIYSYLRCRLGSDSTAEDLCSAVFYKVFRSIGQFSASRGEPVQWLFGIARNEVNSHLRRKALVSFVSLNLFGDIFREKPETHREENPAAVKLKELIKGLDRRERDLISLKFYSELNNRQIAALTGLSESNVGTILYRCMKKLRKKMGGENL